MTPTSDERIRRRQLRGKPLLESCRRAHISHNEMTGVDACYGLTDCDAYVYNDECLHCGALVWNVGFWHLSRRAENDDAD